MMTSRNDEQAERVRVMKDEARLRERATTMHEFAVSEANLDLGRYNAVGKQSVVGGRPDAASAHQVQLPPDRRLDTALMILRPRRVLLRPS